MCTICENELYQTPRVHLDNKFTDCCKNKIIVTNIETFI